MSFRRHYLPMKNMSYVEVGTEKKIYLYTIKTNNIKLLKKNNLFSMGSSFVWRNDGKSFLYTRQTFRNLIKLNEIPSLFLYSLDGKEKKLIDKYSFFGGVQIK
ncbi:hypothetical protein DSCA_11730 [Desulfosarcina alkanivorans]|uniref:Uncharacterized protein n=1 Tax=Desulfosarcina alkanivorans TaxID=571177 RepID=A0A5K7YF90_9BACT|nr:hypothetical protein DSCA_11730 [Desulfosarcina alkanivorans]